MAHLRESTSDIRRRCAFFMVFGTLSALTAILALFILGRPDGVIFNSGALSEPDYSALIVKTSIYDNPKYIEKPTFNRELHSTFGRIDIDSQNIHMPIKWGTVEEGDQHNAGMYSSSSLPGEGGVTVISGHNYPSFGKIYYLTIGDTFRVTMPWGTYTYRVTESRVMPATELEQKLIPMLSDKDVRKAVLYSCYPLNSLDTPDRTTVTAELIDGPLIPNDREKDYE